MIRGVVSALRQIDRLKLAGEEGHVPIVGFDGTPLGLQRIREGTQDADVGQNPFSMAESIVGEMENHFCRQAGGQGDADPAGDDLQGERRQPGQLGQPRQVGRPSRDGSRCFTERRGPDFLAHDRSSTKDVP